MPDVFISYSRKDSAFVRRLHGALAERGRDVWVDWEDIPEGQRWRDELAAGLEQSRAFVFVVTPSSLASEECAIELARAEESGKRIVPVVLQDVEGLDVPDALSSRNYVFFREGVDDFDESVGKLERAIDTDHDWVRDHTRLLGRAAEWDRGGRDRSLLLRGADLRHAEQELSAWREGAEPTPTALQRECVAASRRASGRRTRALLAGTAVALAASVLLGVLAILAREDAVEREREAESRALAVAGLLRVDADPEQATRLAIRAVRLGHTEEAEEALRRGVSSLQARDVWRPRKVTDFDVSPDGRRSAVAVADGRVLLRDRATGRVRRVDRHPGGAVVRFAASGQAIATSGGDGRFAIHRLDGSLVREVRGRGAMSAILSDDGSRIVGVQNDGTVRGWNARTGRAGRPIAGPERWERFEASHDGRRLLVTYADGAIQAFDPLAGRRLGRERSLPDGQAKADVSGDGRRAVSSRRGGLVVVWDVQTGRVVRRLRQPAEVGAVEIDRDGSRVVTGGADNRVRVWDVRTGRELHVLRGHGDTVTQAVLSRNGRRLLTVGLDRTARIWFTETGEQDLVVRGTRADIRDVRMTPDGRHVATRAADGEVRVLESSPGRAVAVLRHRGAVESAVLHPRRPVAASSGRDRIQIVNTRTGAVMGGDEASVLTTGFTQDMAFDPRGARLAVADGAAVLVNDFAGQWRWRDHGDQVNAVTWSRDGRRLVTASRDGTARFLDPADAAREAAPALRHPGDVRDALFTPSGRRVVTLECTITATAACATSTVRLWDAAGRRVLDRLEVPGGARDLALSPDGRWVAV
ncbi:MAG TPA: TIR domain-containing protein, partial [Solirubrobacteraceae bacterium]|nr:TIR domain-containing protein [Solirubrobacteraceae bacterium]